MNDLCPSSVQYKLSPLVTLFHIRFGICFSLLSLSIVYPPVSKNLKNWGSLSFFLFFFNICIPIAICLFASYSIATIVRISSCAYRIYSTFLNVSFFRFFSYTPIRTRYARSASSTRFESLCCITYALLSLSLFFSLF